MVVQVVLYPCRGTDDLCIDWGHVYEPQIDGVVDTHFVSMKEATHVFPEGFKVSTSTSLCPICEAYSSGKIKMIMKKHLKY